MKKGKNKQQKCELMQYLANMVSENVAQDIGEIFNLCEMLGLPFELRQAPVYTQP